MMRDASKDEPAFPIPAPNVANGMSLRDYFAGQVIGHMSVDAGLTREAKGLTPEQIGQVLAATAYAIADAMIAERSK